MLRKMEKSGQRKGRGGDQKSKSHRATLKLDDMNLTRSESSRWQQIAAASLIEIPAHFHPNPPPTAQDALRRAPRTRPDPKHLAESG